MAGRELEISYVVLQPGWSGVEIFSSSMLRSKPSCLGTLHRTSTKQLACAGTVVGPRPPSILPALTLTPGSAPLIDSRLMIRFANSSMRWRDPSNSNLPFQGKIHTTRLQRCPNPPTAAYARPFSAFPLSPPEPGPLFSPAICGRGVFIRPDCVAI